MRRVCVTELLQHLEHWRRVRQIFTVEKAVVVENGNKKVPMVMKGAKRQLLVQVLSVERAFEPGKTSGTFGRSSEMLATRDAEVPTKFGNTERDIYTPDFPTVR